MTTVQEQASNALGPAFNAAIEGAASKGVKVTFPETTRRTERRVARRARAGTRRTGEIALLIRELQEDAAQDAGDLVTATEILLMNRIQPGVVTADELAGAIEDAASIPAQNRFAAIQAEGLWQNSDVRKEFEPVLVKTDQILAQKIREDTAAFDTLSKLIRGVEPKEPRLSVRQVIDGGARGKFFLRLITPADCLCLMEAHDGENNGIHVQVLRIAPSALGYLPYVEGTSFDLARNKAGEIVFLEKGRNDPHYTFRQSCLVTYTREREAHAKNRQAPVPPAHNEPRPAPARSPETAAAHEAPVDWGALKTTAVSFEDFRKFSGGEGERVHVVVEGDFTTLSRFGQSGRGVMLLLETDGHRIFRGPFDRGSTPTNAKSLTLPNLFPKEGMPLAGPGKEDNPAAHFVWFCLGVAERRLRNRQRDNDARAEYEAIQAPEANLYPYTQGQRGPAFKVRFFLFDGNESGFVGLKLLPTGKSIKFLQGVSGAFALPEAGAMLENASIWVDNPEDDNPTRILRRILRLLANEGKYRLEGRTAQTAVVNPPEDADGSPAAHEGDQESGEQALAADTVAEDAVAGAEASTDTVPTENEGRHEVTGAPPEDAAGNGKIVFAEDLRLPPGDDGRDPKAKRRGRLQTTTAHSRGGPPKDPEDDEE